MSTAAIEARGVVKVFGKGDLAFTALRGVDLTVDAGEFVMLAGPSGSGKTTLLSILGCVLSTTEGEVSLMGRRISGLPEKRLPAVRRESVGFIFQAHNLMPSLTALDNVALALRMKGASKHAARGQAGTLLERVGLANKLSARPAEMSGGERQRVAIARSLAGSPPIILADEPTASLDAANGLKATELLREVCRERNDSVLVVTHDSRIFHLADRIVRIEDGCIVDNEDGAP